MYHCILELKHPRPFPRRIPFLSIQVLQFVYGTIWVTHHLRIERVFSQATSSVTPGKICVWTTCRGSWSRLGNRRPKTMGYTGSIEVFSTRHIVNSSQHRNINRSTIHAVVLRKLFVCKIAENYRLYIVGCPSKICILLITTLI